MNIKLLTVQHLEFLSLKGGYTGSSESTLVKMPLECLKNSSYTDNQEMVHWICLTYLIYEHDRGIGFHHVDRGN